MNTILYLLQVTACTVVFYLFYFLFLSRLTFFTTNRWYLLITVLLSFLIPILRITLNEQQPYVAAVQHIIYVPQTAQSDMQKIVQAPVVEKSIHWETVLRMGYFVMAAALSIHLLITLLTFFKRIKGKQIARIGKVHVLSGQQKVANGSFLNYIFLNDEELSTDEIKQIIAHEMLHIKLYHSIDRILIKIAQIVLWFNPFIYLYTRSVEENHEFEVDREIARSTDKHKYANLLLHLSVAGQGMLYHNFSKVPLKKRISMLFNKPSNKMKRIIYVLILPVVLISCLAFARLKNPQVIKEHSVPHNQYYTRLHLKNSDGTYYDEVIVSMPSRHQASHRLSPTDKPGFMVDREIYNEEEFKKTLSSIITSFASHYFTAHSLAINGVKVRGYDMFFVFNTKKFEANPDNKKSTSDGSIGSTIKAEQVEEVGNSGSGAQQEQINKDDAREKLNAYKKGVSYDTYLRSINDGKTRDRIKQYRDSTSATSDDYKKRVAYEATKDPTGNSQLGSISPTTDTIEYNAAGFKISPTGVLADLLIVMPHLRVDALSKVFYNNEPVTKFTFNNKEYNGGDIQHAIAAIPANTIKLVQIIYASANKVKTLNVITKVETHTATHRETPREMIANLQKQQAAD